MKEITINNNVYQFPTCWGEVNIATYKRITELANVINNEEVGNIARVATIASKILNISVKELYFTQKSEFEKIIDVLEFIAEPFSTSEEKNEIEIDDEIYEVINELNKLTVGEMLSFEIATQNSNKMVDLIAPVLALILRKKDNKEFDADNYLNFVKIIEEKVNIETATQLSAFFLAGVKDFIMQTNSENYLMEKGMKVID